MKGFFDDQRFLTGPSGSSCLMHFKCSSQEPSLPPSSFYTPQQSTHSRGTFGLARPLVLQGTSPPSKAAWDTQMSLFLPLPLLGCSPGAEPKRQNCNTPAGALSLPEHSPATGRRAEAALAKPHSLARNGAAHAAT